MICSGNCLTPPTPTSSPWSVLMVQLVPDEARSWLFLCPWKFLVLNGKNGSKLFEELCWRVCMCVCMHACGWLYERACIDGCVYVLERDRIPFVLGVYPLRLLWRFLKGILGSPVGGGSEETTLFLPLAPTLHLYGLKLDSSVFSTEDICIL